MAKTIIRRAAKVNILHTICAIAHCELNSVFNILISHMLTLKTAS